MRRQFTIKCISLSILLLVPLLSHAGGGWVGNSPMTVASAPTTIYQPLYSSGPEAPEKKWNSLLLPDGKSRFSISAERQAGDVQMFAINLGFDHAFTENLTTFSLIDWGYSLLSGNGRGSEVALFFGMLDGIGYSNFDGFLVGPGVELGYSYSTDHWRLSTRLSTSGLYSFGRKKFESTKLRLGTNIQYFASENWSMGLESGARYYTHLDRGSENCESRGCYHRDDKVLFESAMAYVTRKVTKDSEMSLGVGTNKNVQLGYSWNW